MRGITNPQMMWLNIDYSAGGNGLCIHKLYKAGRDKTDFLFEEQLLNQGTGELLGIILVPNLFINQ